jgi:hypothetical protein
MNNICGNNGKISMAVPKKDLIKTKAAMALIRDQLRLRLHELELIQAELETLTEPLERATEDLEAAIYSLSEVV